MSFRRKHEREEEPAVIAYDYEEGDTDKARLFIIDGRDVWIPKSVIDEEDEEENTVSVKEWWALKEGLI